MCTAAFAVHMSFVTFLTGLSCLISREAGTLARTCNLVVCWISCLPALQIFLLPVKRAPENVRRYAVGRPTGSNTPLGRLWVSVSRTCQRAAPRLS